MDEKNNELLPCPFCGGAAIAATCPVNGIHHAGCTDKDCIGHMAAYDFTSEGTATEAWNRRATPASSATSGEVVVQNVTKKFLDRMIRTPLLPQDFGITDPVMVERAKNYALALVAHPAAGPDNDAQCRDDGRCQYAIDHGAEGLGHCPTGKCCMPRGCAAGAERAVPEDLHKAAIKMIHALDVLPRDKDIRWARIETVVRELRAALVAIERAKFAAAPSPQQVERAVQEGFMVVPVEPTPEMLDCMDKSSCYQTWKNMLAAAPSPAAAKEGGA